MVSLPKCINTDCSATIVTQVVLLFVNYSNIVLFPIWFWIIIRYIYYVTNTRSLGSLSEKFNVKRYWKLHKYLQPNRWLLEWTRREIQALTQVLFFFSLNPLTKSIFCTSNFNLQIMCTSHLTSEEKDISFMYNYHFVGKAKGTCKN